jgi:hypothetical protein
LLDLPCSCSLLSRIDAENPHSRIPHGPSIIIRLRHGLNGTDALRPVLYPAATLTDTAAQIRALLILLSTSYSASKAMAILPNNRIEVIATALMPMMWALATLWQQVATHNSRRKLPQSSLLPVFGSCLMCYNTLRGKRVRARVLDRAGSMSSIPSILTRIQNNSST